MRSAHKTSGEEEAYTKTDHEIQGGPRGRLERVWSQAHTFSASRAVQKSLKCGAG